MVEDGETLKWKKKYFENETPQYHLLDNLFKVNFKYMDGKYVDAFSGLGDIVFESKFNWIPRDIHPFPMLHFRQSNNRKG